MKTLKRCVKIAAAVLAIAAGIFIMPPWWGTWASKIHIFTGIPYFFRPPPKDYTGEWVAYEKGGRTELSYRNGARHGVQRYYDWTGTLNRTNEFRDGKPWSGLCELSDYWSYKPWAAVYLDGKVWTGAMREFDHEKNEDAWSYHYEGKDVSEAEFRRLMGFSDEGSLFGLHLVKKVE